MMRIFQLKKTLYQMSSYVNVALKKRFVVWLHVPKTGELILETKLAIEKICRH